MLIIEIYVHIMKPTNFLDGRNIDKQDSTPWKSRSKCSKECEKPSKLPRSQSNE